MKKLFAIILCIASLFLISASVTAAEITQDSADKSGSMDVSLLVAPSYTVTIPATAKITAPETQEEIGSIQISSATLHPDKCIRISLNVDDVLKNTTDASITLPYRIMTADSEFVSAAYLTAGEETPLFLHVLQEDLTKLPAGDYKSTLCFTISYETVE